MLVEDEQAVRRFARIALQQRGYHVIEASNGVEALRVAESHPAPIDLLITDMVMPGMGGAVADALRQLQPALRVLYVSGYTDDEGVRESEVHFCKKPYFPASLARQVRQILDKPA